jgi:hypothetical protein
MFKCTKASLIEYILRVSRPNPLKGHHKVNFRKFLEKHSFGQLLMLKMDIVDNISTKYTIVK